MTRWMVTLGFSDFTPEMLALVPAEQAHVRELMGQGKLESINIAADGSNVWIIMHGESKEAVAQILSSFPMYKYFSNNIAQLR